MLTSRNVINATAVKNNIIKLYIQKKGINYPTENPPTHKTPKNNIFSPGKKFLNTLVDIEILTSVTGAVT